jgi:hypothetical protein
MEVILKGVASAIIAYTTHYGVTKFYNYVCVPDGLMGYLSGLITVGSPVCKVGVQVMSNTEVSYSSLLLMGASRALVDTVMPGSAAATKDVIS